MRFVPTRVHGIADWRMGVLLVTLPWLVGLDPAAAPVASGHR
ncbi:MAG: hypothetical protein AVDCRST_MAG11-3369 [uncultured Gemmatimonadaceae bacterium]|uniref:Uncharacterized protein n=1 Tax=uncultured Gemmatimonadaceae bacterium TaxID=246130 RepID=A0A6J4M2Z7_9BACT|nr:MAG: hypothetical protein AVDCRST_MAG11-3369 [uncultured Gemmatimonadaceae bacterium]